MEDKEDFSPKSRAKKEVENVFNSILEKIEEEHSVDLSGSDLQQEDLDTPTSNLQEEMSVELSASELQEDAPVVEVSASDAQEKHLVDDSKSDLKEEEHSIELLVSKLKAVINQVMSSTKEDIQIFYDELAKFHDKIEKLRNDVDTITDKMNNIDEILNKIIIEKDYEHDIEIASAKIIEADKDISETVPPGTLNTKNSSTEELASLNQKDDETIIVADTSGTTSLSTGELISADQASAEPELKSIEQPEIEYSFSFDEVRERLKAAGIFRGGDTEPYYTVCKVLVGQDTQKMAYDALLIESKLQPQRFSQVIFDLTTKKILDFDGKTEIIRFQAPK